MPACECVCVCLWVGLSDSLAHKPIFYPQNGGLKSTVQLMWAFYDSFVYPLRSEMEKKWDPELAEKYFIFFKEPKNYWCVWVCVYQNALHLSYK